MGTLMALSLFDDSGAAGAAVGGFLLLVAIVIGTILAAGLYFLPCIIAFARKKSNSIAILALNLFLGWSFIGWIIAMVWALTNDTPTQQMIVYQQAPHAAQAQTPPQLPPPGPPGNPS